MSDFRRSISTVPRMITPGDRLSDEQVWALPPGSVVKDSDDDLWLCLHDGGWYLSTEQRNIGIARSFPAGDLYYYSQTVTGTQTTPNSEDSYGAGPLRFPPVEYAGVHL